MYFLQVSLWLWMIGSYSPAGNLRRKNKGHKWNDLVSCRGPRLLLVESSWLCFFDPVTLTHLLFVNGRDGTNEVFLSSLGRLWSSEAFILSNDWCLPYMLLCGKSSLISKCERGVGTGTEGIRTKCTLFVNRNSGTSALILPIYEVSLAHLVASLSDRSS